MIEVCQTYDLFELSLFYLLILFTPPIEVEAIELMVLRYLFYLHMRQDILTIFVVFCAIMLCELWWCTEFTQI